MTHLDPKALEAVADAIDTVPEWPAKTYRLRVAEAAYLAALPQSGPGGWVLVPRKLTVAMEQAEYDASQASASAQEVWAAMLAASPTPAVSREVTEEMVDSALAYWCSKLPKAQREQPIPDKLREHMRSTLAAALSQPHSEK